MHRDVKVPSSSLPFYSIHKLIYESRVSLPEILVIKRIYFHTLYFNLTPTKMVRMISVIS